MSIELAAYIERATFEREIETLFGSRYCIGRVSDFPDHDCYRSFTLGSKVVTVRRTTEGLRAFGNVCLHRSKLIDPLGDGKRPFFCSYHGWGYGADGVLSTAPMTDVNCIKQNHLPTFKVQQIDDLVFLDFGEVPADISKVDEALAHTGISFSPAFHRETLIHRCNWKLLIDNVLESYHFNLVHRNTFVKSGFTSTSDHRWQRNAYLDLGLIEPLPNTSKLKTLQRLARKATHLYKHAYVFPNLLLSNTSDLIGYLGRFHPVDAQTTVLFWELFELPEMLKLPKAVRENLRDEAAKFAATTLEEDRVMIESCQIGAASRMGGLQLQPAEGRVAKFHEYYEEQMRHVRE